MKLYDKAGSPKLDLDPNKEINRGGEGAIYVHPNNPAEVIKVYHTTSSLSEKCLSELMQLPDNFIKPKELFYDRTKKIKGLSMKYLDTHRLTLLSNIFNKATAQREGYTDDVKKRIYEGIVHSILAAHKQGIIVGDLNPYNIFVSPKGEVYFIDVDSFQTSSREHSGTLLPEVRDWLYNNIDEKSDYYALSVLIFQMLTHLHPYKGVHSKYRTLEERAVKQVSVLSGDKDLVIPSFYEPITDFRQDYWGIFQEGDRQIPRIGGSLVAIAKPKITPTVQSFSEGEMTVRILDVGVDDFNCSANYFYVRKRIVDYGIYACKSHGITSPLVKTAEPTNAVFLGDKNIVSVAGGKLHNVFQGGVITSFVIPHKSFMHYNAGKVVYFDESNDSYSLLNIDAILNNTSVYYNKGTIFTKSVDVQSGIIQSISGMKWILDITSGQLRTLRTLLNLNDVFLCPSGMYGVVEAKTTTGIEVTLFKVEGMRITLGPKLNGMCTIAEKAGYLFIPTNDGIDVHRTLDLVKVATLACKYVNEQSVLRSCNAGLLCLTGDTLYLLNKT